MRVLILGSEGFIGSYLAKFAIGQQWQVTGCDQIEVSNTAYQYHKISLLSADIEQLFSGQSYDVCINAAGSGNVPYSLTHPLSDFEANVVAVTNVLEAIRKFNSECRYLHISSAAVYGNPQELPIHELAPTAPLSPYGWHKLIAEHVCNEYYVIYNLKIALIRPFSVYGERLRKQLLWDICNKLQQSDSVQLYGTGNESRDFIHIVDLVRLIFTIIQRSQFNYDVYNAASGEESTIRSIANVFEQYYLEKKNISFSGEVRIGDPLNWRADIQKVQSIGFQPTLPLSEGIKSYIKWYHSITK